MSITVQYAANRLLGMSNAGWLYSTSTLPAGCLATVAACLTAAEQEMRLVNPSAFSVPRQILLNAPATDTCTVATLSTVTPVTAATIPNAGVTVQVAGVTRYNQIASHSGGVGTLLRTHEGSNGAGQALVVWHDCWVPADGSSFERVLGDVTAEGRRLIVLSHKDQLDALYRRRDFGEHLRGYIQQNWAGAVEVCWTEHYQSAIGNAVEARLRFFPMPSAITLIEARVVNHCTPIATADFSATTRTTGTPGGNDETFFWPLVMNQWSMTPWFQPGGVQSDRIARNYATALDRLAVWRPQMDAGNVIMR